MENQAYLYALIMTRDKTMHEGNPEFDQFRDDWMKETEWLLKEADEQEI